MKIVADALSAPIDAIVFDCDGTLSKIEGIDELARNNGVEEEVSRLTAQAMGKTGINPEIFQQRLHLVKPTFDQVIRLIQLYYEHKTPGISEVMQCFQTLGKPVYIVSAGLLPAVLGFGELLSVPKEHIFAVNVQFDSSGNYSDFDRASPLVFHDGKRKIVEKLKNIHPRLAFVGDGTNDLAVHDLVTRFIGYGGAFYRESIAQHCEFYINEPSIFSLLNFCLTSSELSRIDRTHLQS